MKLAFSTLACPGWSLDRVAAAAREYGYDGVELRLVDGEILDAGMPAAESARVRDTFERAHVAIAAVDSSVRIAADDDAAESIAAFVDLACAWDSRVVRVFGGRLDVDGSLEEDVVRAREVLGEASLVAESSGVAIALETHDRFSSAHLVARVMEGLPPSAGALWDVAHPYRAGETAQQVVRQLGSRIVHVHVKDCRRAPGDDWRLALLGEGEVPVRECINLLRAMGYSGWLSVEWEKGWHPELAEPEVALPQFATMLREWI
jgi:sugar phosphate isomerase/epimerase